MPIFPSALPTPRTPDPMDAPSLRWGVLGTGWIAERFVRSVVRNTRQRFVAVASRDSERAKTFADRHSIPQSYGSYEELATSGDVDVVYVATDHIAHLDCAKLALNNGKHALIEKPLALNAIQATEIAELAADRGLFCAEALWTLFLPKFDIVRQLLESGVLGETRTVIAELGEYFAPDHRIFRRELAGGPLLDLGTYPVCLATWILGAPAEVLAFGQPHHKGINGQISAILLDTIGNQATIHTTLFNDIPSAASVVGTRATLSLPGPFFQPGEIVLSPAGGSTPLTYSEPRIAHDGLYFEAAEVARCIAAGELQTPLRPLEDSIIMLRTMDSIREMCGITF
ncbi:MAG: Gfo/Idh/MocA family oxidoreductase [Corynebacteriales bacterium]|nr:Gfo/Idh/MocA family oxidoreductase [Mycobacteriales bacterium]